MRVTGIDLKLSLQQSIVQRSADLADAAAIGFDGFTVQVLAADGVAVFRLAGLDGLADGEALTRQENRAVQVAGSYGDVSLAAGRTAAVAGGVGAEAGINGLQHLCRAGGFRDFYSGLYLHVGGQLVIYRVQNRLHSGFLICGKAGGVRSDDEIAVIIPCDGGINSGCVCNRNLILYKLCDQCGINGVSDRHNDFVVAKIHQCLVAADKSAVLADRAGFLHDGSGVVCEAELIQSGEDLLAVRVHCEGGAADVLVIIIDRSLA